MPRMKQVDLAGTIRRAMVASGLNSHQIALRSGVGYTIVKEFTDGNRGLNLDSASRLCSLLKLDLKPRSK